MFELRSPLATHLAVGGRDGADGRRSLRIGELAGWHLVQIGVFERSRAALAAAVEAVCGCALPSSPRTVTTSPRLVTASPRTVTTSPPIVTAVPAHRLYRIAEDQYWLVTQDRAAAAALSRAIAPQDASITVLDHARIRLLIEGAAAAALLARLVTIDLRPTAFPAGCFAQTGVHHAGVLLERSGAERYEMYVLRTFAVSTWEWIVDAAMSYGYDIIDAQTGP